ncbi:MAG: hypothetical protein HY816_20065 [Candidatus Wallbacteria bacterium]|nr:hypothetical protein [Candidatus Wallbacteria bacterium]
MGVTLVLPAVRRGLSKGFVRGYSRLVRGRHEDVDGYNRKSPLSQTLFKVRTKFGFTVECDEDYWTTHVLKQRPWMKGFEDSVAMLLEQATEAIHPRLPSGRIDYRRYCFYGNWSGLQRNPRRPEHLLLVVVLRHNGIGEFKTAHPTAVQADGERTWPRSK